MDTELLIRASRKAYRFPSIRGLLTLEDLWQLPLTSSSGVSLDSIAKTVNLELRNLSEDSFVSSKPSIRQGMVQDMLDLVKGVIKIRLEENEKNLAKIARADQRRKLLEALETKESQELTSASKDELLKKLAELDA